MLAQEAVVVAAAELIPYAATLLGGTAVGSVIGGTFVHKKREQQVQDARLEEQYAHQQLTIANEAKNEAEKVRYTDGLTGLPLREPFNDEIVRHLGFLQRNKSGKPGSVIYCDVDHFKRINDDYGHAKGDEVLQRVAAAMQETLREEDMVARYGGEEFTVFTPDVDEDGAIALAERVREAVKEGCRGLLPDRDVTLSAGLTLFDTQYYADVLIQQADAALYEAKRNGRDRVEAYPIVDPT